MTISKIISDKKAQEKHPRALELQHSPEDIRWATPDVVASYRAKRLHCATLVDVGCGIGFQTFAFAKLCKQVYAIDIDPLKIEKAKQNASILGLKNITFIVGDALSPKIIAQLKDVDVVFCDPARLPEEKERKMETITPDVHQLLENYGRLTKKIAIEFPPQMREFPPHCEREYLSWQGKLNRLTLYFGGLKKAERSAVTLPSEECLVPSADAVLREINSPDTYLFDVDPAVVKADVLAELSAKTGTAVLHKGKNMVFTSSALVKDPFFVHAYKVVDTASFDQRALSKALQKARAGNVVLRYSVDPQEYASIRRSLEKGLKGQKMICLFRVDDMAILAEEVW